MAGAVIRVFPRRTSYTPRDALAFVGDPPLLRPLAAEVHVSVTFTWDIPEGKRLAEAWAQYYPVVRLGGPAFGDPGDDFVPGRYVRSGVVFTSRGCNNRCPWCLVPDREGPLRLLPIAPGHIVQDNNFLQCPAAHRQAVYRMLARQPRAAVFAGGLQADLVTDEVADELRAVRIGCVFLAADTDAALRPLERALRRLSFLRRDQLRCYVLCGYGGETVEQAEARLERVWEWGAMPFAQLYQPPDQRLVYGPEWRALARRWSRPAIMKAVHREAAQLARRLKAQVPKGDMDGGPAELLRSSGELAARRERWR
jgi:hypothetical protein